MTRRTHTRGAKSPSTLLPAARDAIRKAIFDKTGKGITAAKPLARSSGAPVKAAYFLQKGDVWGNFEGSWAVITPSGEVLDVNPKQEIDSLGCANKVKA